MKIALLAGRFGRGTGTGGVAYRLASALLQRGHEVAVWCDRCDEPLEGVLSHALGPRAAASARVPAGWVRLALDRVPGCEVARASGGVHEAWLAARGGPRAEITQRVGVRFDREAALDRHTAQTARAIVCNSLRAAGEVMAYHGIPASHIHVIRNGVDLSLFRPDASLAPAARARWKVPSDGRAALFLGHGFRRKGLQTAVRAFAIASRPNDRLIIAGGDAHATRWYSFARRVLGERVVITGPLRPIERFLPGADVLLLPSRYDSASNAVLEAMASGVTPIVSARDGAAEVLPDRLLAVADPDDVQGFARAVRYAWGSADLGARCATAAKRWPETRMASAIEHLLMEFANG